MRKYTKPVILILVAVILGGVYFYASTRESKSSNPEPQGASAIKVFEVDSQKVSEVSVEKDKDKFVIQKKDKDFVLTSPADLKADSSKLNSVVTNASNVFAEKVVEENTSDPSKYGFNNPTKVTVKYDGGVEELEIGDMNSTKDSYYLKEKNSNKIYTIGTYTIQAIMITRDSLRDKALFDVKAEDITGLSFKRGGSVVFTSKKGSDNQWTLTEPFAVNADATSMTSITNALAQVKTYVSFIEEKPSDLDKYGLKNPVYSLTFETTSGKKTLLLGNDKAKGAETYAMLEGSQQVFTVDPTPFTFLDKPLREMMETFAYIVNIQDVSKIVVDMDGKTTVSELETNKDDSSKDKFTVDGKDANVADDKDNNLFRKYYQALIGVNMTDVDTNFKPAGNAEITFTYTLKKDPGVMKVEFVPRDANYYYVVKNGKYANIIVDKRKFDEDEGVRKTYKALVDAMNKK